MKKKLLAIFPLAGSFFSVYAQLGQTSTAPSTFSTSFTPILSLIAFAQTILNKLVPFTIGLAVLAFFWFLVLFIWKASDNPTEQAKLKSGMLWSIIALFVMVAIWGIVGFIANMLGVQVGGSMPGFKLPGE